MHGKLQPFCHGPFPVLPVIGEFRLLTALLDEGEHIRLELCHINSKAGSAQRMPLAFVLGKLLQRQAKATVLTIPKFKRHRFPHLID